MRTRLLLNLLLLALAATASAEPELITWRQDGDANVSGWRLYVQQEDDLLADVIDVPMGATPSPDGIYARFVDRDPSRDMWITVVALDLDGEETPSAFTRTYPAFDQWAHCQFDFDHNGAVGGTDWWLFANSFGTRCE